MKEFTLDTPEKPLDPSQRNAIYWRAWEAVEKAQSATADSSNGEPGKLNRFTITRRVLGGVVKISEMTDDQFKKLIRAFGHIAKRVKKSNTEETEGTEPEANSETSAISAASCETARPARLSDFQAAEQSRRELLLDQLAELQNPARKGGAMSLNKAAAVLGEPASVLCVWRQKRAREGVAGLKPKQADKCGRKPKFVLNEKEQAALRHCQLRKDSLPLAIEDFINDADCRPETRAAILEEMDTAARERRLPRWPVSIQRAGYVSDEMRAHFRGEKHARQFEIIERRGMWLLDPENGVEIPMGPNTLRESDDMSSNKPHRYVDPRTGNLDVGRQNLATIDVYSNAFLGVSPIGRDRDAYRLEDIADHLHDVVLAHGLPQIWRFERGPWENQVIDGIRLKPQIRPPDWDEKKRWGGLEAIFRVQHVFTSGAKGTIESSFNLLQALIDHDPEQNGLCIGRRRGEFEQATRLLREATDAKASLEKRARAAMHFWDIAAAADGIEAAMQRFNARPKIRKYAFGKQPVVPNDLFASATRRECPAHELWRFSPVKDSATVRGGAIEKSIDHYPFPFRFRVNGCSDPKTGEASRFYLEHGYSVLIAFHPGRPEEGCHVFNAERGARNREGLRFGELMFVAPLAEDAPQLNLRPDEKEFLARKNSNAAVRAEFRAIVGPSRTGANGSRARRVSTARDGYGDSARVEQFTGASRSSAQGDSGTRGSSHVDSSPGAPAKPLSEGRASARPKSDFDEEAELSRIEKLERAAIDRGEILISD